MYIYMYIYIYTYIYLCGITFVHKRVSIAIYISGRRKIITEMRKQ